MMEDIDLEIEKAKKKLAELEAKKIKTHGRDFIKPLEEFTQSEKNSFFDSCYNFSISIIEEIEDGTYYGDNDDHQYAYEHIMEILARDSKSFWKSLENFTNLLNTK